MVAMVVEGGREVDWLRRVWLEDGYARLSLHTSYLRNPRPEFECVCSRGIAIPKQNLGSWVG